MKWGFIARNRERILLAVFLGAFCVQTVGGMRLLSASSDETSHLPSGYTYLKTGELRLNPQHPPLIKQLCAAPLLFLGPRLNLQNPAWMSEPPDEWRFGYDFLYSNDADRLLFWGRIPVVALAVLLGFYLYRWAGEMFGKASAWTALFLYSFSPNLIAHSRLVTMDLGLACFTFLALYHLWRFARKGRKRDLLAAGLGLGLALATKFSAVVLVPIFALLLFLSALRSRPARAARGSSRGGPIGERATKLALAYGLMLALAFLVVYAVYVFPPDPLFYWKGLQRVNQDHNPDYAYYLMGEFKKGGWWYYFLIAFLVKTPLPTLLMLGLSLVMLRRFPAGTWIDESFLIVPILTFTIFTSALADNLGVRYLLPIYPLVFLFVSRLGPLFTRGRAWMAMAAILGIWYLGSAVRTYPNHLSYFSEIVGGPARGHRYLDDSNIDWGHGLKQLKAYMELKGIDRIKLLYGWNGSPDYYGIRYDPVSNSEWASRPSSGIYAVSAHLLIRGEYHAGQRGVPTNWLGLYEPTDRVGDSFYIFEFGGVRSNIPTSERF